jgi:hypothetical protein
MSGQALDVDFAPRGFSVMTSFVLLSAFCSATSLAVGDRSRPKLPSGFEFGRNIF